MKKNIKTENHLHKGKRTQIVTTRIGFKPVPLFGQWTIDEKGERVPKTWDAPIIQRNVIHHTL